MSSNSDESFLSRWSRKKRGDERGEAGNSGVDLPHKASPSTKVDDEAVDKVDLAALPKIEDLLPSSDISAFLQKGVPEELKRLALRKAWSLDPQIRDFIEVAENQYDWNKPDGVPGFGPLDPGTDIEALLKQATGQLETLEKQVETSASERKMSDRSGGERSSGETTGAVHADASAAKVSPDGPEKSSAAKPDDRAELGHDAKPIGEPGTASRRRHGGALPD